MLYLPELYQSNLPFRQKLRVCNWEILSEDELWSSISLVYRICGREKICFLCLLPSFLCPTLLTNPKIIQTTLFHISNFFLSIILDFPWCEIVIHLFFRMHEHLWITSIKQPEQLFWWKWHNRHWVIFLYLWHGCTSLPNLQSHFWLWKWIVGWMNIHAIKN